MARDALDPGPDGTYPYWPRHPDGSSRMPPGERWHTAPDGRTVLIDTTVRDAAGEPIVPPDLRPPR